MKTRQGNFASTNEGGWLQRTEEGDGIFAVVGCEISITRVPGADSIIGTGLITDSIVATSAPRNLFLFAPKRVRRIYYAARSILGPACSHSLTPFPVLQRRVTSFYHADIPCNFLFPALRLSFTRTPLHPLYRPPLSPRHSGPVCRPYPTTVDFLCSLCTFLRREPRVFPRGGVKRHNAAILLGAAVRIRGGANDAGTYPRGPLSDRSFPDYYWQPARFHFNPMRGGKRTRRGRRRRGEDVAGAGKVASHSSRGTLHG